MAGVDFSLKEEDLGRIQEAIMDFGNDAESVINECLKKSVSKVFRKTITNIIPVSEGKYPSQRGKIHAKTSNPLRSMTDNLTLTIKSKTEFNYLYFPQMGEGTSKYKQPNDFMEKGIDAEYDNAVNIILEKLQRRMEEI